MSTHTPRPQISTRMDLDLRRRLQAKLILEGRTLRDWVEEQARQYLGEEPPDNPTTKQR